VWFDCLESYEFVIGGLIWTLAMIALGISIGKADRLIADVHHRLKEKGMRIVLVFALMSMMLLMGCLETTDPVPPLDAKSVQSCDATCAHQAAELRKQEQKLFVASIKACNDKACRDAAVENHVRQVHRIADQLAQCHEACHHQQGDGLGGQ